MITQAININEINKAYGHTWAIADFLIADEHYPCKILKKDFRVEGFVLAMCLQGEISLEINGILFNSRKKNIIIAKPLNLIRLVEFSDDCRMLIIVFSKSFLVTNGIGQQVFDKLLFSNLHTVPVVELSQSEAWDIEHQIKALGERARELDHPGRKQIVVNLVMVVLHDIDAMCRKYSSLQDPNYNSRGMTLTIEFSALVQQHFREKHDVAFYAQKLHVTPKYLSAVIKETTGKTASAIISDAISMEAQVLIKQANVSVKEASTLLHFPDQSTFGKFFKRSVGISPVEYRRQA